MKLSEKIEVPELDELRVARLERGIVAQLASMPPAASASSTRIWKGAVALAAVAGVVLAIVLNLRGSQVELLGRFPNVGETTKVVTGPGQSSQLVLGDAVVGLGADTQLGVERFTDGRILLHLEAGAVHCEVAPRNERPAFQVVSGDVRVSVIGTGFDVERSEIVEVRVQHGIVAVQTSHEDVRLKAGQQWQGSPDAHRELAMLLQERQATRAQQAALDASDKQATGKDEHHDAGKHNKGTRHDAGVGQGVTKGSSSTKTDAQLKAMGPVKLSEILKSAKPLPPIFKKSQDPAIANLQEVSATNPKAAVKQLEALAAKLTGDDASFAMYSRAYLLFFKLHDNDAAVTAANQYARRFPRGAEAEDMLWLRVRASCESNRSSTCRAAAHTYLRNYPEGIFKGLCSRIVETTSAD